MRARTVTAGFMALSLLISGAVFPLWAWAEEASVTPDGVYVESDVSKEVLTGETAIDGEDLPEYVSWLMEVAAEELGYQEGPNNLTKYGTWTGNPNDAWCAEFLCWCVDQVDQRYGVELLRNTYPYYTSQNTGRDWFISKGRFVYRRGHCPDWGYQWILGEEKLMKKNEYIPKPGDWVFFSYNDAGDTEHVALVEYCTRDAQGKVILHVIEGNNPSSVQRNTFYLDNGHVLGFGTPVRRVGTIMRSGNRGDAVLDLQTDLYELGYLDPRHITGSYGTNTIKAVADFQRTMKDQKATGIADMDTQIAIANLMAVKEFNTADTWLVGGE